jgi:hypothetical protein
MVASPIPRPGAGKSFRGLLKRTLAVVAILGGLVRLEAAEPGFEEWRNTDGSATVRAKVIGISDGFLVIERAGDGRRLEVHPERFHPADRERMLELAARMGKEPAYPQGQAVNDLLGFALFPESGSLWKAPASEMARGLGLRPESRDSRLMSFISPAGETRKVLGETCYQLRLFADHDQPGRFTLLFDNAAAAEHEGRPPPRTRSIHQGMEAKLREVLGPGIVRSLFRGGGFTEHGRRWDVGDTAIFLVHTDAYVAIRIMPVTVAENAGRPLRTTAAELREWTRSNVEERGNGDRIIRNIPMTDQGPYGFCVPATFERYLRYMRIPADMHLIAMHAGASPVKGTSMQRLMESAGAYTRANQRRLQPLRAEFFSHPFLRTLDEGRPIVWRMSSTPPFNTAAAAYTQARGQGNQTRIEALLRETALEVNQDDSHVLLITGYHPESRELRISDSWGPAFEERWIPLSWAQAVSQGSFYVIDY